MVFGQVPSARVGGGGGPRGSWDAGAEARLLVSLPPDVFQAYLGSSVSVYNHTFAMAEQVYTILNTWCNHVHGFQLVGEHKPVFGRSYLDLEYLNEIFQNDISRLDLDALEDNPAELVYTVTNADTMEPRYITPNRDNIFTAMKASCALWPAHGTVDFQGMNAVDGGFSDPLPVKKALEDGYERALVVTKKASGYDPAEERKLVEKIGEWYGRVTGNRENKLLQYCENYVSGIREASHIMQNNPKVDVIQPESSLGTGLFTRDKRSIRKLFKHGWKKADEYLRESELEASIRDEYR